MPQVFDRPLGNLILAPSDLPVLLSIHRDTLFAQLRRSVGSDAPVHLVEGGLTEQSDQRDSLLPDRLAQYPG